MKPLLCLRYHGTSYDMMLMTGLFFPQRAQWKPERRAEPLVDTLRRERLQGKGGETGEGQATQGAVGGSGAGGDGGAGVGGGRDGAVGGSDGGGQSAGALGLGGSGSRLLRGLGGLLGGLSGLLGGLSRLGGLLGLLGGLGGGLGGGRGLLTAVVTAAGVLAESLSGREDLAWMLLVNHVS